MENISAGNRFELDLFFVQKMVKIKSHKRFMNAVMQ